MEKCGSLLDGISSTAVQTGSASVNVRELAASMLGCPDKAGRMAVIQKEKLDAGDPVDLGAATDLP